MHFANAVLFALTTCAIRKARRQLELVLALSQKQKEQARSQDFSLGVHTSRTGTKIDNVRMICHASSEDTRTEGRLLIIGETFVSAIISTFKPTAMSKRYRKLIVFSS